MRKVLTFYDCSESLAKRFESALSRRGGQAIRSFDLRSARAANARPTPCPCHHTTDCSCQYLILIVYMPRATPTCTVVLHEFEGTTRVTLDDPDDTLAGLLVQD